MTGAIIKKMISYFCNDAKRINHALKVYGFACCIGNAEDLDLEQQYILEAAAVLHDIGIKESERKYNSTDGKYQELEGPPIARQILEELGADSDMTERICFLIGNHHSYGKIDGTDFQILVEADFLVNIYEDGLSSKQIESITEKYFKTEAGKEIVGRMYRQTL